jgi:hypothetical protein
MKIVLVIFFLSIQSSYSQDTEVAATEQAFDTVQFLATDSGAWRIRTYASDEDVHVWSIGASTNDVVELARSNTEKHFGDVLSKRYILESDDGIEGLRLELKERGLPNNLEQSKSGFLFWAPEGTNYRSKSTPRT